MTPIRWLLIVLTLALGAAPARAAEPTYPPGSRIGLTPPAGLAPSGTSSATRIPTTTSPSSWSRFRPGLRESRQVRHRRCAQATRPDVEAREAVPLPSGPAFMVIGRQEMEATKLRKWILVASSPALTALVTVQIPEAAKALYPDDAIRAALATVAIRTTVPVEEQLGLVPFKVGELAGFRIGGVLPGRAVMLSDAPRTRRDPSTRRPIPTSSLPSPQADRRRAESATPSPATSSRPFRTSRTSASPRPNRCGWVVSRATRFSPLPRTQPAPPR